MLALPTLLLDGILALAVIADMLSTPSPDGLGVGRSIPPASGLSQDFQRLVRVDVRGAGGLKLELREEFGAALEVVQRTVARDELGPPSVDDPTGGPDELRLPQSGSVDILRVYRSSVRGVQSVGHMRLRLHGRLGLILRQKRLVGMGQVSVKPPLLGLSNTLKLAASERWHDLGVRRLRRRGGLTEFESLRDYVDGDDVRLIDWKAFARRGRPTVREFQEEQGQELILVVDCGRVMGATTARGDERGWTKLDFALDTALQIAAVALQGGDRVGIAAFDSKIQRFVAPVRGSRQLARLQEAVFDLLPSGQESDLAGALQGLAVRHSRRATLLIISDVADPLSVPRQMRALATGGRQHRVIFASLDDPALRHVAEGREPERAAVRATALALAHEREVGLGRLSASGVRVLDALPAEAAAPILAAWLDARRAGL